MTPSTSLPLPAAPGSAVLPAGARGRRRPGAPRSRRGAFPSRRGGWPWALLLALLALLPPRAAAAQEAGGAPDREARTWVCPPCAPHDTLTFERDGTCPVCGMALIERPDSSRVGDPHVHPGSGNFLLRGGPGHRDDLITVFYHRPRSFTPDSPVLVVVPGAGRNGDEYRDAWIRASEAHGVLVLSPMYPEAAYGFGDYHMGGLLEELNVEESVREVEGTSEVVLDEEALTYRVNPSREEWIFRDFDRLFREAARAVGSRRGSYDLFGHSAGGQALHRMVLLARETGAETIVAANSGFYTVPDPDTELPFGLADAPVGEGDLERAFGRRLVILLGEEDAGPKAGGTLLRSPTVDEQGAHRLERGRHFYDRARARARELGVPFEWRLEVVPGVGHDFRGMSRAAAELLYGEAPGAGADRAPDARRGAPAGAPSAPRFAADPAYRFTAPFEPLAEPRLLRAPASAGGSLTVRKVGSVEIPFPRGTERLGVFRAGEGGEGALWIPFRDATNGEETYRAGRYVDAERAGEGRLRVDFNRAYNPRCAYDPGYACPLPPPGNRLPFRVPAGAKKPPPTG